jgi:hypothetical protein
VGKLALALAILAFGGMAARAAEETKPEPLKVELNAAETAGGKCRLSFVVQNGSPAGLDSLKLDLVVFGKDGAIQRRLLTEMGPVRPSKTVVRTFEVEGDCGGIGSILLNEVPGCTPASFGDCLDRMTLSSRVANLRFYK